MRRSRQDLQLVLGSSSLTGLEVAHRMWGVAETAEVQTSAEPAPWEVLFFYGYFKKLKFARYGGAHL